MKKEKFALYMRNFVFGVEDSLVSTVGMISGIAVADVPRATIILSGIVLIFVEAFSMGVGSLLSEHSSEEFLKNKELPLMQAIKSSIIMFISYFFAGFVPLAPYILFPVSIAFWLSIGASLFGLFVLGILGAKILKASLFRHGMQMLLIGGIAILLGVVVGQAVNYL